ncbi:MAG: hypothetical protein CM15mV2_0410 [uncultured marine virus]|nr:MAG: hypothetical protein CM15mV2_0410 [uncultured marine virus]
MDYKNRDKRGGGYPQFVVNVFEDGEILDTSLYHTMIGLMSKVVDDILPDYKPIRIRGILQTPIKDDIIHYPPQQIQLTLEDLVPYIILLMLLEIHFYSKKRY